MIIDYNKIKIPFKNMEIVKENYSQAAQDIFVLCCLNGKTKGTYLDLGCRHPIEINNTYLLESQFNWKGVSVDIDNYMVSQHSIRNNPALCEDATKIDFDKIINILNTNHIDYLSLDLEPASVTDECLRNIPFDKVEFSVITYEHDEYRFGEGYKISSRNLLESYGYKRICSSVCNEIYPYEDWYYNPKYVSQKRIQSLDSNNMEWGEILFSK